MTSVTRSRPGLLAVAFWVKFLFDFFFFSYIRIQAVNSLPRLRIWTTRRISDSESPALSPAPGQALRLQRLKCAKACGRPARHQQSHIYDMLLENRSRIFWTFTYYFHWSRRTGIRVIRFRRAAPGLIIGWSKSLETWTWITSSVTACGKSRCCCCIQMLSCIFRLPSWQLLAISNLNRGFQVPSWSARDSEAIQLRLEVNVSIIQVAQAITDDSIELAFLSTWIQVAQLSPTGYSVVTALRPGPGASHGIKFQLEVPNHPSLETWPPAGGPAGRWKPHNCISYRRTVTVGRSSSYTP